MKLAIYMRAENDRDGNPRRGWLLFDGEAAARGGDARVRFVPEGYSGRGALALALGIPFEHIGDHVVEIASVEITPREYRARRNGGD